MTEWTKEDLEAQARRNPDLAERNPELNPDKVDFGWQKDVKPSKYRATRTEYNGRTYPSEKQAKDAAMFEALTGPGLPYKAYLQEVPFRLPGLTPTGRPIVHRVDHMCIDWDDKVEFFETKCRDIKGRAKMGELKRSQVEQIYHIKITLTD